MFCPKCGQVTVNINDKDICTKCGIVFGDENHPREQVLRQVRDKVQRTLPVKEEPYVSPVAVLARKESPKVTIKEEPPLVIPSEADIEKEYSQKINLPIGNQTQQEFISQEAPSVPEHSRLEIQTAEEAVRTLPSQPQAQTESFIPEKETQIPVNQTYAEKSPADLDPNLPSPSFAQPAPVAQDYVYPSHQVNPVLIRIFIASFSVFFFFLVIFLVYLNFDSVRNGITGFTQFLGENAF